MRITESQLRQIVREEASRLAPRRRLREAAAPRITSMEQASYAIESGSPAPQDAACRFLAQEFQGSPTPGQDISMALMDLGVDEDTAFDIGESCEMKYM